MHVAHQCHWAGALLSDNAQYVYLGVSEAAIDMALQLRCK